MTEYTDWDVATDRMINKLVQEKFDMNWFQLNWLQTNVYLSDKVKTAKSVEDLKVVLQGLIDFTLPCTEEQKSYLAEARSRLR